jgi:hypothetical protein
MKFKILLSASLLISAFGADAQNANRGYAITGDGNHDYAWMNIREIDLNTGKINAAIFDHTKSAFNINDLTNKKTFNQTSIYDGAQNNAHMYPTATLVAASAFDNRGQKLFFIPMRVGQLRWIDVTEKSNVSNFYSIDIPNYVPSQNMEEANNITRMVIGADGVGYAITNDGNHLYKFTTGRKPSIVDLGALIDADANAGISVHNKCSSWGGDMIADAFGKLYIISATKNVFEVNVASKTATHKGSISGLPANFTTNGAAVTEDGEVLLSSAISFSGFYKMNMKDLAATPVEGSDVAFSTSDLASSNLLYQAEADAARKSATAPVIAANLTSESNVFPNPVSGRTFNVMLSGKLQGNYTVLISDLAGRVLQTTRTQFTKGQQTQQINLLSKPTKGTYVVKVLDENKAEIITDKVVIL